MDSGARRWVLKPLSPLLQASDLRTISSDSSPLFQYANMTSDRLRSPLLDQAGEVVEAVQVSVSQDESSSEEWESHSPSSDGSLSGFYSFVDDPDSPEAGLNQAWMVSAQRRAQLATLKEGQGFTLQTYSGSRRPESLFPEGDQDCRYRAEGEETSERREMELRQEIIRSQAPRKGPSKTSGTPISPDVNPLPEGIDKEQINFTVAREQFLKLEKEQLKSLPSPPRFSRTPRHLSLDPKTLTPGADDTNDKWMENLNSTQTSKQKTEPQRNISCVSKELSSSLQNLTVCTDDLENQINSSKYETPIEREIRRALEREDSLRFSRGLKLINGPSEIIQIRRKPFSSPLVTSRPRDKSQVSFMFQKEVQNQRGMAEPQDNDEEETERKDSYLQDKQRTAEKLQNEPGRLWCRPQGKDSMLNSLASEGVLSSSPSESSVLNPESSGMRSRETRASDFIHKETQDVLRRAKTPRNLCRSEDRSLSSTAVDHRTWKRTGTLPDLTPPPAHLLTNQHSEDHKLNLKLEESRYAGIHPVDDINNQVVEATRVVRHKNQRTLRWEAGVFANQEENQEENQQLMLL